MSDSQNQVTTNDAVRRPWIVISAWEVLAAHFVAVFVGASQIPRLFDSPGIEERLMWAPAILRYWIYLLYLATLVAPCTCTFPLLVWCLLPKAMHDRLPIHWLTRGSPPFVGAILSVAITAIMFVGLILLAELED